VDKDRYIFLLTFVGKLGDSAAIASRLKVILESLKKTLSGELVSLHVTMGDYDFVAIVDIPKDKDRTILDCLRLLRSPGDIRVTILRAFDYQQVHKGVGPQKR